MVTLTAQKLGWLVARYVPACYQPQPHGPVKLIETMNGAVLTKLASVLLRTHFREGDLAGVCIDMNELRQQPDPDSPWFHIYLVERFRSRREVIFSLLHEIGHVDWHLNHERRQQFQEDECELYADWYAFDQLANTMGLQSALDTACRFPSVHGLGRELIKAS